MKFVRKLSLFSHHVFWFLLLSDVPCTVTLAVVACFIDEHFKSFPVLETGLDKGLFLKHFLKSTFRSIFCGPLPISDYWVPEMVDTVSLN